MESLIKEILSKAGDSGIQKIADAAGINPTLAKVMMSQAGPLLASKMADNIKEEKGLSSLNRALDDHNGSIFDRVGDLTNPNIETKGDKILEHILGNNTENLISVLARKNNTSSKSSKGILEMVAPLILGQLGFNKKSKGLSADGIFDILQREKKTIRNSKDSIIIDLASNFLDKDDDGSIIDDVLRIVGKLFKR